MTVKVLIKRNFKEAAVPEISKMLIQARTNALGKTGYISSETLRHCENPNDIMVISMWRHKEDWDAYRKDQGSGYPVFLNNLDLKSCPKCERRGF